MKSKKTRQFEKKYTRENVKFNSVLDFHIKVHHTQISEEFYSYKLAI